MEDEDEDQDQDQDQEETTFWGCHKCGKVWRRKSALDKAISKSVKRFPYRKKSYVRSGEGWKPGLEDDEHPDYEELVDGEPSK
jgi:Zn-finger nucleic acid-binding protein